MKKPAARNAAGFPMSCPLRPGRRPGRDGDLDHFAATAREAGEHRLDQARDHDVEPVGLRTRLGAPVEQRRVGPRSADVEVDLTVIFDIGVDPAAVPEGVVPTPSEPAAPAEARAVEEGRAPAEPAVAVMAAVEGILDDPRLTVV